VVENKQKNKTKIRSTGANPTIVGYNVSAVKIYSATSSVVHFKTKIFFSILKIVLAYYNADIVVVN
jgi:hypothetical protein